MRDLWRFTIGTKLCRACDLVLPNKSFYKDKSTKDGLDAYCNTCRKSYKQVNKLKIKEVQRLYRQNNKDSRVAGNEKFRKNNPNYSKDWFRDNPDKARSYSSSYLINNRDKINTSRLEMYRINPSKYRGYSSNYRASKSSATPSWLTKEQKDSINNFYEQARDCEVTSGMKYEVDHIIPLNGKNVCGLHVPWNLQVLPRDINRAKSNSLDAHV